MSETDGASAADEVSESELDDVTGGIRLGDNADWTTVMCSSCGQSVPRSGLQRHMEYVHSDV